VTWRVKEGLEVVLIRVQNHLTKLGGIPQNAHASAWVVRVDQK
jgi:hypothetical protein